MLVYDGYSVLCFLFIVCFTTHTLFTAHDSNPFLKTSLFNFWSFQGHWPLQFVKMNYSVNDFPVSAMWGLRLSTF